MEHRVSNTQIQELLDFLETNSAVAKGVGLGSRSKENLDREWDKLAAKLNAHGGGSSKSGKRWKRYWADLKHKSKSRAAERRREARGTGGGPSTQEDLSEVDKKVLAIIGEAAVFGDIEHRVPAFITVRPTDSNSVFTGTDGEACQCVPYYLCDEGLNGVHVENASVTGYGQLDIRFGGPDSCQESVEVCCKHVKSAEQVPVTQKPEPPRLQGCGYRNAQGLDFTIAGGSGAEAEFGEFPWVVALLPVKEQRYLGVGVLIHPEVVMTGAHIASNFPSGNLKIRAGEWDTQTSKERLPHQERTVRETVIHEGYRSKNVYNDIALLRLDSPLVLDAHINVICLPELNESFDQARQCVANGWGKDVFGKPGRYAVILKRVVVDMIPQSTCTDLLRRTRLGPFFKLHSSFVCAGGEEGKDTCQGDGGAPLACPIGNDRYKLSGLVSWGIGCGQKNVPAVYVNVPIFRRWIDDKMAAWGYDTSGYRV